MKDQLDIEVLMANADISAADVKEVAAVVQSGRLSMGPMTEKFEQMIAHYCGARYAIAVNSGTSGLHLLTIAAGVRPGDEIITTSFSFVASTNCFVYEGGRPIFVDVEPDTYCLDPDLIEAAITPRTKGIVAVDVFGHPAQWDRILAIASRHGLWVIDDSCESIGAEYRGQKTGPFGLGGVFAFFPNKQMTTGEGGVIVTNEEQVHRTCRSLRNQGRDESGKWLNHVRLGFNYRLDEMSAALGVSQLSRIDEFIAKRYKVAGYYGASLGSEKRVRLPQIKSHVRMSYFVYVIELQTEVESTDVIQRLADRGIPSRGYFSPIHTQPYIQQIFGSSPIHLPVTDRLSKKTVALPFHNNLSVSDVEYVCKNLREVMDQLS